MPTIGIFYAPSNRRSRLIGEALRAGAKRLGLTHMLLQSTHYRKPDFDVAIFYGLADGLRKVFDEYRRARRAIYIDLGYWGRRKRTRYDGFHKISLNNRHPTAYFQHRQHSSHRFEQFRVKVQPWRGPAEHILLAGMSAKAAAAEGFAPEEWERAAVAELRRWTDRPIVYRPKPNWPGCRPIAGTRMQKDVELDAALLNCHAVVTHHSNVAVEALLAGVPCICPGGVASVLSAHEMSEIENLRMPDGREQWAADIAWTQWSMDEMVGGSAFRYMLDEGLIA